MAIIHLDGDLTKPATTLIEKICGAVGGAFAPWQTVRMAKAEAKADLIQAEAQIQRTELQQRAFHRFIEEEVKKQGNIEEITRLALPFLQEQAKPEEIQDDWITNFFEKCRSISEPEMQQVWAHILAGEANTPGSFSRKTVNLVADLEKADAQQFTKLCGFCCTDSSLSYPLVYNKAENVIYTREGINFMSLSHLVDLGLIQFNTITGFSRTQLPKEFSLSYFGNLISLTLLQSESNILNVGNVLFTNAGRELSRVCIGQPVDGFIDFIKGKLADPLNQALQLMA